MIRRCLALLLLCFFPLQNIHAAWHDYSDHAAHIDGVERFLFHTHEVEADHDGHHRDLDHAGTGDSQHDGEMGHSHSPHVQLLPTVPTIIAPTLHHGLPPERPVIYLSAILKRLDRPPHTARR
jgi:hypothetical protein